ncbi:MAG: hypothetical protein IPL46_27245 [Saprospiraceae bacterium]|nr:hypothetical protein [Saprospiraceae bacterium]
MQDILRKLDRLEDKVLQLSQKIEYLRKENIMLIEENVKIKQESEKIKSGKNAQGLGGKERVVQDDRSSVLRQTEQMKKELDRYIVEVDKCIELINNM